MPNNNEIIENENSLTYQNQRFYGSLDSSLKLVYYSYVTPTLLLK